MSTTRDNILASVRASLGRNAGGPPVTTPDVRLNIPQIDDKIGRFRTALETLAGKTTVVHSKPDVLGYVRSVVADRLVVCADSPLLHECGIDYPPSSVSKAQVGITTAEYALADTGSLVILSSAEARLPSLLPPVHIAVIESSRILASLDELLTLLPLPADTNASMVLITGPSRTADIEQILVRGVHGPGELHVVILD